MAAFPIGALISAGASLFGSHQSRRDASKARRHQLQLDAQHRRAQQKFNETRIQTLVKDAKAAGIHPLAALGSPVAGGFAAPVPSGQSVSGSGYADGIRELGAGVDEWQRRMLAETSEKAGLENELLRSEISLRNAQSRTLIERAKNDAAVRAGITVPNVSGGSQTIKSSSAFSDAEEVERRYGDIVQMLYGLGVLGRDLFEHYTGE